MATPTSAEINTTLANCVKPTSDIIADAATILSSIDTAEQALEGDFQPGAAVANLAAQRGAYAGSISPEFLRNHWRAWLLERLRLAGYPLLDVNSADAWYRIHRILHEGSETFNDRDLTVPASGTAGGSNAGGGTLRCLAVDWEGYNLQLPTTETKRFECIRDQGMGRDKYAELFRVTGEDQGKDLLEEGGSGTNLTIQAMHAGRGAGGALLQNASFDSEHVGAASDKVPGWTLTAGTIGDLTEETSTVWRTEPGASTSRSLEIASGSGTLSQALSVRRISAASEWTPWMLQVAIKKTGGSDTGTLTLHCGSQSQSFNLANSPFNTTDWVVAQLDFDKDLYYRNWFEDDPTISIQWASTSDVIWIDGVHFAPLTWIDGLYYWLTSDADQYLLRDYFTHAVTGGAWADAEMMNALRWAARSGGNFGAGLPIRNLPVATSAGENIGDP